MGALSAIRIYPVKSCRPIELSESVVAATGLDGDREWQVVSQDGAPVTQRTHPSLTTVQPELLDGGLELSAPGMGTVSVGPPVGDEVVVRALLGDEVAAVDAGDEAAAWLSRVVGEDCRLVRRAERAPRSIVQVPQQPVTFVDAAPVLVTCSASLGDLVGRAREPFGMERFRPNLVVDTNDPWVEDTWRGFSIGSAELTALFPWPRCAVPQVDQQTGRRTREPAVALRAHRWCVDALAPFPEIPAEARSLFGIGCAIGPAGTTIRLGDQLAVYTTGEPAIPPPSGL